VWDARVVKPLDPRMIADAARHPLVITVEDGIRDGGAGAAMADAISADALDDGRVGPPVRVLGTPCAYIAQGKPDAILRELGLDAEGITAEASRLRSLIRST
jgi:1-deoxy-D-xylulose-5-phosphate synthase